MKFGKIKIMNGNKTLYISGKITGLPMPAVLSKFKAAQSRYERTGLKVINPLNVKPLFNRPFWFCYMIADIRQLLKCDTIVLLSDWHDSKGARIELVIAIVARKQIIVDRSQTK